MNNITEKMYLYKEEFLTISEVGDILRLGRDKTRKLVNSKGFPCIKIGTTIRIPKDEFVKWYQKACYTNK